MKKNNKIAMMLMALGAIFLAIGVYNKEVEVVLNKAIRICLECVGIG